MNVASWLYRAGCTRPRRPAVVHGAVAVADYGSLARRSAAIAGALSRRYGLTIGDRVAVAAKNCPAYLEVLFGIWWAGMVAVPVNAKLHPSEIGEILADADARALFLSPDLEAALGARDMPSIRAHFVLGRRSHENLAKCESIPLAEREADDLAWLFYTSGTTGRPKGAMLTHRNLMTMSLAYLADVDVTRSTDTLLHAAPMSHGSGLYALPHVCRIAANAVPESGEFEPAEVLELMRARPGTSMFAAPTMIRRMVACRVEMPAETIRTLIWGGAPMNVGDTIRALDHFGPCLAQIYGQGETPMTITVLAKGDLADRACGRWIERIASAGVPHSVVEVRTVDPDDVPVGVGEPGEVVVRGDTVMRGYWKMPDASEATLRGGWLHTGDIGSIDEDGFLTLKDRSKDVVISGGSNIYPREVEDVLVEHPRVEEACVIGRPDPEWGEVVVAYVVGDADPAELDRLCLERIARFKRPKDYVFVSSLPKNNYGKTAKAELRASDAVRSDATATSRRDGAVRSSAAEEG